MPRPSLLVIPCLALASAACHRPPSTTPEEPVPVTQEDPLEGDPAAIEREEIGEDHVDSAKVVEPGPAEAEVQERDGMRPD